jgi:hypothetical protein
MISFWLLSMTSSPEPRLLQGWLAGVLTTAPFFKTLSGYWQAQLLASMEMIVFPPSPFRSQTPTIKTALPNGLHCCRGVQNMRVWNMKLEIPITAKADNSCAPDLTSCCERGVTRSMLSTSPPRATASRHVRSVWCLGCVRCAGASS